MDESEKILVAGLAEWIMGSSARRSERGYYFVTTRGFRFGTKEGGFLSKSYRDEFIACESITDIRTDYMQAMDVVGDDGKPLAVIRFPSTGFQHAGHAGGPRSALEQARNVAVALGHPFEQP
jgi:hypothetical protein